MNNFQIIILIFSLSIDLFFVGLSFGMGNIAIKPKQNIFLNLVGTLILTGAVLIGESLYPYIRGFQTFNLPAWILILLGTIKTIKSIKEFALQKKNESQPNIPLNQNMTYKELAILAVCLSLDNTTAGISLGLLNISIAQIIIISFFTSYILLLISNYLGKRLSSYLPMNNKNNDWISGIILILIGLLN